MSTLIKLCVCLCLINLAGGSILAEPPQSAVVVAFEDLYDLSLLANTLSDAGIDATLIIPSSREDELYESLIDVEVLTIDVESEDFSNRKTYAIQACESLLSDENIKKKIQEIQPTFTIFPAMRHDGCLLPWAKFIDSIPVIWTRNPEEELYVFDQTGAALPIQNTEFLSRLSTAFSRRSTNSAARDEYASYALKVAGKYLPEVGLNLDNFYADVRLVLWGGDIILRSNFASLTQLLVEVGCHHCRGPYMQPLQENLQKFLIEHRQGTVVSLLDESHKTLVTELAKKLPQGRDGQAVVWKKKLLQKLDDPLPENLYIDPRADRQDLIGHGRTRVLLSHCADTELLEAGFHGTPVICFPRNHHESRNAERAVRLGFASNFEDIRDSSSEELVNVVTHIHETPDYRENARKVSLAIRDRLNPASDRLVYWLRYMARMKGEKLEFLMPMRPAKTFSEDIQFCIGLLVGTVVGVIATIGFIFERYVVLSKRAHSSKRRYSR